MPRPSDDDLDSGWGESEEDATPGERAEVLRETAPPPDLAKTTPPMAMEDDVNMRVTIPPPMPVQDYVRAMMASAREDDPESIPYRAPMATLMEMDPLQFDMPDSRAQRTPAPSRVVHFDEAPPASGPQEVPSIETGEETLSPIDFEEVEPDPIDELDDLPFDTVLAAVNKRTAPSPTPGLRLGSTPSALARIEPPDEAAHDRQTMTGEAGQAVQPLTEMDKMRRRFEAKDYSGALMIAESLTAVDPANEEAASYAATCKDLVCSMYLARLGDRLGVPRVLMSEEHIHRLALDHRSGFVLSCIDGEMCLDELLSLGMPELDMLRTLYELVQEGVIEITQRKRG